MPSIAAPNRAITTMRSVPPTLPENISIIAPIIATIGRTISICAHCRAGGGGISGGASSSTSPAGISGAGLRCGRFTTTVATLVLLPLCGTNTPADGHEPAANGRNVPDGPRHLGTRITSVACSQSGGHCPVDEHSERTQWTKGGPHGDHRPGLRRHRNPRPDRRQGDRRG